MKLIAFCPLSVDGARVAVGDTFETSDHSGAKLIKRGAARAAPKSKPKPKKPESKGTDK